MPREAKTGMLVAGGAVLALAFSCAITLALRRCEGAAAARRARQEEAAAEEEDVVVVRHRGPRASGRHHHYEIHEQEAPTGHRTIIVID